LLGQVGDDDIAVRCPKCRSLNSSAEQGGTAEAAAENARKTKKG
jgi:phage FluMu protein Com